MTQKVSRFAEMNLKRRKLQAFMIIFTIILITVLCFVIPRIYYPRGISNGYITNAGKEYVIPKDSLEIILKDLRGSFMRNDNGYFIWFDESFSIMFTDDDGQLISKLKIAKDGSPIFSIVGEPYCLIGKERAREIIDEIIQTK